MTRREVWSLLSVVISLSVGFSLCGFVGTIIMERWFSCAFSGACLLMQLPALVYTWAKTATVPE